MLTVHVRVNDEATGKPVPVRLRITDAAGRYYPPLGRLAEFATSPGQDVGGQARLGHESFAFVDGTCEVRLPPGALHVEVDRGPEYSAVSRAVELPAGRMALRFGIGRWIDWRADGWYAGDTRAHELTPHAAALEGAAAGLSVVHLLARERPPAGDLPGAIRGLEAFSGTACAVDAHGCQVVVNTLNAHPVLGTVSLLDSHRPVFPLRFGAPGAADDWSVADWCDQCHRKAGLVVWPDLPRLTEEHPQGEALAALILGKVDAYEIGPLDDPRSPALANYYRLLDCGLRPVLVGGSGKDSNAAALGSMRTYAQAVPLPVEQAALPARGAEQARLPALRQDRGWLDAVRAGRTFITTAPLLSLSVAGQGPGSVLAAKKGQRVRLRAEAHSAVPFTYLEILVNGEPIATKTASGNQNAAAVETDLVCDGTAWVAAACHSDARLRTGPCVFAHTSPVYLDVPGEPPRPPADSLDPLLTVLARTRAWVESEARLEAEKQRRHLLGVLDEARDRLLGLRG